MRIGYHTRAPVAFMFLSLCCIAVGVVVGYYFVWKPMGVASKAKNWPEVPCIIEINNLHIKKNDDKKKKLKKPIYMIDIQYSYQVKGKEYKSTAYGFMDVPGTDRDYFARIVTLYLKGKKCTCFVNPDNPSQAVINRNYQKGFLTIIPAQSAFFFTRFFAIAQNNMKEVSP